MAENMAENMAEIIGKTIKLLISIWYKSEKLSETIC